MEFLKTGMEELKEQVIAVKDDVARLKPSRLQLHHTSDGNRQYLTSSSSRGVDLRKAVNTFKVLKVCANHFITQDMILSPISNSKGLAWLWVANDFADEEVGLEKLSARFKTLVDAEGFKGAFEKAKEIAAEEKPDISYPDGVRGDVTNVSQVSNSEVLKVTRQIGTPKVKEAQKTTDEIQKMLSTPEVSTSVTTTTESSKVVLGGFTFVSPPTLKPVDDEKSKKSAEEKKPASKPSIFAGFSFGQTSTPLSGGITWGKPALGTIATTDSSSKDDPKAATDQKDKNPFENSSAIQTSFASLAAEAEKIESPTFQADSSGSKGFEGAEKTVFSSPNVGKDKEAEGAEGEFMPTVEFKPVIPLPQLVEVKTGEEGEVILFENRAKLLRYGNKEWIEFGIGQMKITWNPQTGKVRLIMRREQVLKVCCNHFLTEDMQFKALTTSDRCWTWHAQDYADGTLTAKTLAIKFKTSEEAMKFKNILDDLQKNMVDGKTKLDKSVTSPKGEEEEELQKADSSGGCKMSFSNISEMFKPEVGSWECQQCYIRNKGDTKSCAACCSIRPGFVENSPKENKEKSSFSPFKFGIDPQVNSNQVQTPTPAYTFGIQPSAAPAQNISFKFGTSSVPAESPKTLTFGVNVETPKSSTSQPKKNEGTPSLASMFKPEEGSWECQQCYLRNKKDLVMCISCSEPKPGTTVTADSSSAQASIAQPTFKFGIPSLSEGQKTSGFGVKTDSPITPSTVAKTSEGFGSFSAAFKPEEGSWECKGCYVRNKKDVVSCSACGETKPGHVSVPSTTVSSQSATQSAFRFGIPLSSPAETNTAAPTTAFTFGTNSVVTSVAKPAADAIWAPAKFTFGGSQQNVGPDAASANSTFGKTSFMFGSGSQDVPAPSSGFTFASNQKYEFNFKGVEPKLDSLATSPSSKGSYLKSPDRQISHDESGGSDLYQEEDDGDHIHFQPVIPLPDKVPVHTGEEDEEILYEHRPKLYRWNNGEWKERGCGDIKILKHNETGRVR